MITEKAVKPLPLGREEGKILMSDSDTQCDIINLMINKGMC